MTAATAPLGVGIVGCGQVAGELHVPALRAVEGARLVAVADVDASRARALAAREGVASVYEDAAALAADPAVDLVAVCVPPRWHADAALAALDAGRHLFVEKPLAETLDDADAILAHPALGDVTAVVGFNLRAHRLVRALHTAVREGEIGAVHAARVTMTSEFALQHGEDGLRSRGGTLLDLGVHVVDLWRHLLGDEVERLDALEWEGGEAAPAGSAHVLAGRTAGGTLLSATFSQATSIALDVELIGDRGRLTAALYRGDGLRRAPVGTPPGGAGPRAKEALRTARDLPRQAAAARRGGDFIASYVRQWELIATGAPAPLASLDDGRAALAAVLACSARV